MQKLIHIAAYLLVAAIFVSCENETKTQTTTTLELKTKNNSSEPSLHKTKDGKLLLSWIETDSLKASQLVFSELQNGEWSESKPIAKGTNWFVNWADFPSLSSFGENNLVAHYLEKSASGTYTYDVKLTISNDNGTTWNAPFKPHTDNTESEHGFVSKLALNKDTFMSIWLDGRQFAYAEKDTTIQKEMTLRAAIIDYKGELKSEFLIDNRVCECCQTDITMTSNGPMVVYRNRSEDEIRDIYFTVFSESGWTEPIAVFNDSWEIAGCPVNGPAVSSKGNTTATAWFTMQDNMAKVKMAFYDVNKNNFNAPILVDFIDPLGRLDIEVIDDNSAIVSWVDAVNDKTNIQLQRVFKDGRKSNIVTVSGTSPKRSSGFPRMVIKENYVYLAWTDANNGKLQVQTAKVNLNNIK